ncbi:LysR family transcriptional regulator [Burkholderia cenocepacia]|uniref:LysR family transcriptional regulator n=1 Tax=Burkholderia cenocepacia TaxID=95486 RepID=UPI002860A1BB|nr:LysR family transcriptional regulator [Burkholderia cenocepacia]MDR8071399.1 LysR family transcriptional regulator [Burkholderia cenocepacia]
MAAAFLDCIFSSTNVSDAVTDAPQPFQGTSNAADALDVNLRYLQVFVSVSATGGVSQASRMMFRAQSGMTRSIKGLEKQLGCELFERSSTGMRLTAVGKCVLARAGMVISHLEQAICGCAGLKSKKITNGERALVPACLLNARRLEALVLLEKTRHMPTAARALGITQPAVSAAMAVLQAGAGCKLFERCAHGISPTKEGRAFAHHCAQALNELKKIRDDISAHRGSLRGHVVVGALPLGRSSILPGAIAALLEKHPGIRVTTDESCYRSLATSLRTGDVDFILGALREVPDEDMHAEGLFKEGMSLLVRTGHPLSSHHVPELSELFRFQWILPRSDSPARKLVDAAFHHRNLVAPSPAVETADLAIIRGLLLGSNAIAVVSDRQLDHEIRRGDVVKLHICLAETDRWIGLLRRKSSNPSPAAGALMEEIKRISRLDGSASA